MDINNKPSYKKKAILSLIFGVAGILLGLSLFSLNIPILALIFLIVILEGILGILGLILGIKSLKVVKSVTGISGTTLCIISILLWAYIVLFIYAHL